ncbi:MAG: aminodeoxychorismate synthase component I [bacterium]
MPIDQPVLTAVVDFPDHHSSLRPTRRVFRAPARVLRAATLTDVVPMIDEAERHARAGGWSVGFVSYEAAPAFDAALAAMPPGSVPLAWFALFDAVDADVAADEFPPDESVSDSALPAEHSSLLGELRSGTSEAVYVDAVRRIKEYISAGDAYQVNFTVPFTLTPEGAPLAIYERMRSAQAGRYSSFLDLGDVQIMSASPELFFDRRGTAVRCRPMKGTRARSLTSAADSAQARALRASEKDRAENTMIVDLTRNDLGRVARIGTVCVTSLHEAERYPSVWQLTSTVEAELVADLDLSALFRALFPAGSITGAPKIRAMEIIRELEARPREVYCGSIGIIRPGGDATFNVAIRTAWTADAGDTVHLDAGGAVTSDSTAAGELDEVRTKVNAFTTLPVSPDLFETIRVEAGVPQRLERHLERLRTSASYFDIPFNGECARASLQDAIGVAPFTPVARARLTLRRDGRYLATAAPFVDAPSDGARPVGIAPRPMDRTDVRFYHKTHDRRIYDDALSAHGDYFDVLLWNAEAEVTEFTRGNLVVERERQLRTPPVQSGLLAGVLRGELLEAGVIGERVIRVSELRGASRMWFVNALRGWIPVVLAPT